MVYGQYEAALLFSDRHKAGARKMENRWSLIAISAEKLNEECKRHICLKTDNIQKTTLILEQKANIKNYSVYPDNSIRIYDCLDNVRMISKLLTDNEIIIDEISVQGEDLETYFENLIGGRKNV